jgi:YidC/Oxa1 family membrane protein insertase
MDRNAIIAILLSLGIWIAWQKVYLEPIQEQQQQHAAMEAERQEKLKAEAAKRSENRADLDARGVYPESERRKAEARAAKSLVIENADTRMVVTNEPTAVRSWELKEFSKTLEERDEKVVMRESTGFDSQIGLRFSDASLSQAVNTTWDSLEQPVAGTVVSRIATPGLEVERTVSLDRRGYGGRIDYRFRFLKEPPRYVFLDLFGSPKRESDSDGSIFGQAPDKVHVTYRDSKTRFSEQAADHTSMVESGAGVRWLGLDTRYFVLALVPESREGVLTGAQLMRDDSRGPAVRGSLVIPTEREAGDYGQHPGLFLVPRKWKAFVRSILC